MPLTNIQTEILRLLAAQRDPESYVAGATALNRDAPRYSGYIDIFHDREERVAFAALTDAKTPRGRLWRHVVAAITRDLCRGSDRSRNRHKA